ncbi:MAG: hypothetical protein MPJ06_07555 [Nitrosopumilus sp.]|nr:hypothetical protein [Nitrosopumilus sp.]MDA7943838.1 hypothetical protein [Nitrosopumilus sp.]MDA7959745.1 hypothetical protein [Nitrosopumilus sp.]MDA7999052.1 hypothetical protein [Nitrosopumilus sp.]
MDGRININVSAVDYDRTSAALSRRLSHLEAMTHGQDEFAMTDSEFAFGWHFFVLSVSRGMVERLAEMLGGEFDALKGKGMEKKFLTWLEKNTGEGPRFKLALKDEMESSKFGIF